MKSRSGLNAYQAPKPATTRISRATFKRFDMICILLFRFRNQLLVGAGGESLHVTWTQSVPPAVAGRYVARHSGIQRLRTHPLPQGVLTVSKSDPQASVSACCGRGGVVPRGCFA